MQQMINSFINSAQKWLKVFSATATILASLGMTNRGKSAEKLCTAEKHYFTKEKNSLQLKSSNLNRDCTSEKLGGRGGGRGGKSF